VAHGHRGRGLLYAKLGRREQARVDLSAAIVLYRAMEMTFWLPQAEAALGVLTWLWVMVNTTVALFAVQSSRSREAFERLVERWAGILVSDGYGVYCQWLHGRQTCRKATDWMVLIIALVSSWGECEQGKQLIFQR
jgi:hypothetical protein